LRPRARLCPRLHPRLWWSTPLIFCAWPHLCALRHRVPLWLRLVTPCVALQRHACSRPSPSGRAWLLAACHVRAARRLLHLLSTPGYAVHQSRASAAALRSPAVGGSRAAASATPRGACTRLTRFAARLYFSRAQEDISDALAWRLVREFTVHIYASCCRHRKGLLRLRVSFARQVHVRRCA
jgi:hypothetical protein